MSVKEPCELVLKINQPTGNRSAGIAADAHVDNPGPPFNGYFRAGNRPGRGRRYVEKKTDHGQGKVVPLRF